MSSNALSDGSDADPFTLVPADAAALDALVDAGFDIERVAGDHRERASRIAAILGLIDTPIGSISDQEVLVDAVLARLSRAAHDEPTLSYRDESALESWVMAGYSSDRVPASLRSRARRLEEMRSLVVAGDDEADLTDLTERTLARLQGEIDAEADRMSFERERSRRGLSVRLADLTSVAAVLLIGAAIVWPMISSLRHQSHLQACASNMQAAGMGFGMYAGDHRESLPVTTAGRPGRPWWNTGTPEESNSANLYRLVSGAYADVEDLACPGNPNAATEPAPGARDWQSSEELSYSYRIMIGSQSRRPNWGREPQPDERSVVIADRSPIVAFSMRGQAFVPETNSLQHGGEGQQVLMNDGSGQWLTTPVFDGDNIWLPARVEQAILIMRSRAKAAPLSGTEIPADATDDFVGP